MDLDQLYEKIKEKPTDELLLIKQGSPDDYDPELMAAVGKILAERGVLDNGNNKNKESKPGNTYIRGSLWAATAVIPLIIILMLLTNPERQEYVDFTKQQLFEASENNPIAKGMAAIVPESIIDAGSVYRNYYIFGLYDNKMLGDEVKVLGIFNRCLLLGDQEQLFKSSSQDSALNQEISGYEETGEPDVYFINRETAPGYEGYYIYRNSRYGFYIYYPEELIPNRRPVNGDGQAFTSQDSLLRLTVFGSNLVMEEEIQQLYRDCMNNIAGEITYSVLEENYFVLSWLIGDSVYYQKSFVGAGSQNTFILSYPQAQGEIYDETAKVLEASFFPGDLELPH
jgi:hypothetical protein